MHLRGNSEKVRLSHGYHNLAEKNPTNNLQKSKGQMVRFNLVTLDFLESREEGTSTHLRNMSPLAIKLSETIKQS